MGDPTSPDQSAGRQRLGWTLLCLVVGFGLFEIALLHQRWRFVLEITAWIWPLHDEPPSTWWWPWALAIGAATVAVCALRLRGALPALALLVIGAACWQWGLAAMEGPGLEPLRDRFLRSGHGEIALGALHVRDPEAVVRNYESYIDVGLLRDNVVTKPPGHLLLYHLVERRSRRSVTEWTDEARLAALQDLAARWFPLLAALTLLPLYLLGRIAWDDPTARLAAVLYALSPAPSLIVMHFDQVLFPSLALALLILSWWAARFGSLVVGALAGVAAYATLFVSFALLGIGPLCVLLFALGWAWSRHPRRVPAAAASAIVALAACHLLAVRHLGYDALARFDRALSTHAAWKLGQPGFESTQPLYWLGVNALDWAYWLGWPVAALALVALLRSLSLRSLQGRFALVLSAGLAVTLVILGAFGRTTGETGRLWIFLMPVAVLVAAWAIRPVRGRLRGWVMSALLASQATLTLVMKVRADF